MASWGSAAVTAAGSVSDDGTTYKVGNTADGTLGIDAASVLSRTNGYVGYSAGASGTATVSGSGSTWANTADLAMGYYGSGTLTVQGGAQVSSDTGRLGFYPGSSGTATVTGAGSAWTSGAVFVGETGSGTLNIQDGGQVSSLSSYIGSESTSAVGIATVSGAGSKWTTKAALNVSGGGNGTLNIQNGGQVSSGVAYLAYGPTATGTVTLNGTGSTWTNGGTLYLGYNGHGAMSIQAGARVSDDTARVGSNSGSTGTATVSGAGSTWDTANWLYVGDSGGGALTVQDGGQVTSSWSSLGSASGSTGTATVSGAGSTWSSDNVYVGDSGNGTLTIRDGGRVTGGGGGSAGYIGYGSGSTGTVSVAGAGSTWNNIWLYVGFRGDGTLSVSDGGLVTAATIYAPMGSLLGNGTIAAHGAVLDADLVFDATHGAVQTLPFGTGGTLNLDFNGVGELGAGYKGTGSVRIADGRAITSNAGYLGYWSGSTGTATVSGAGSTWVSNNWLWVGNYGNGTLNIQDGGQVTSNGWLGLRDGSTGTVTVSGAGSTWNTSSFLQVGAGGSGTLNVLRGGQVSGATGYVGYAGTGTATVSGAGSAWTNSGALYVGYYGSGTLNVSDHGQVTARSLSVTGTSVVRLEVSESNMLVLGDATTVGSVTNDGTVMLYADASLAPGVYTPIAEYAGRSMSWSGGGSYTAVGGTWDGSAHTFTVAAPLAVPAGAVAGLGGGDGQRLVITDADSGRRVGASFGAVSGSPTFSATPMSAGELSSLAALPGFDGQVLDAWDFATDLPAGSEVLLSFDVGAGYEDLQLWHLSGGTWTAYVPAWQSYGADGVLDFTVSSFSGYAVTGAVPEPAALCVMALGGLALLGRVRRR